MRVVKELQRGVLKISVFNWNNKYIIKLELGNLEQTFKISELDLYGENQIEEIISDDFLHKAISRFDDMAQSMREALKNP